MKKLSDLLIREVAKMDPYQIRLFRAELARTLPAYIQEVARQVQQPWQPEKQVTKKQGSK